MVVEVIDAPWAGIPARFRWHKRRWICREHACQTVTLLEHDERMCAPRARLGARAIRRAIGQLRFEGNAIAGQASDDQHCMTCTSHGSNGKISTPGLSTDARLKLIVQPAQQLLGVGWIFTRNSMFIVTTSKSLKPGTKIDDQTSIPPTAGFQRSVAPRSYYHAPP